MRLPWLLYASRPAFSLPAFARMIIGLLSDTHGDLTYATRGYALLKSLGVTRFIHAGDVGGESILDLFAGDTLDFVFGNNDVDRDALASYAASIGLACHDVCGSIAIDEHVISFTHGDRPQLVQRAIADPRTSYLIVGHTHLFGKRQINMTQIINPGALHRAKIKTVATLNPLAGIVQWFDVATGALVSDSGQNRDSGRR